MDQSETDVPNATERQRLETQQGEGELIVRLQALAERTGGIAHDLNNMLGTIIGYGALMLEDLPEKDPNRLFLSKVLEAGAEAKLLVAQLMDNAQIETLRSRRTDQSERA
jgi:two-component system, cell cycle sensor histidine kinase and response regulator CckA